jgi:hypothetical protein
LDPHAEINDFGKVGSAVRGTGRAGRLTVAQAAAREGSLSFFRVSVMRQKSKLWLDAKPQKVALVLSYVGPVEPIVQADMCSLAHFRLTHNDALHYGVTGILTFDFRL